jgi:hypothetical protein
MATFDDKVIFFVSKCPSSRPSTIINCGSHQWGFCASKDMFKLAPGPTTAMLLEASHCHCHRLICLFALMAQELMKSVGKNEQLSLTVSYL